MTITENNYCYGTYTTHFKILKANTTTNIKLMDKKESFEISNDLPSMSESNMTEILSSTNDVSSGISTDTNVLKDNFTPETKNNNLSNYIISKTIAKNQNFAGVALVLVVLIALCLFVAKKRKIKESLSL